MNSKLPALLSNFVCEYLKEKCPEFNFLDYKTQLLLVGRIGNYIMKTLSFITKGEPFDD